MSAPDLSNLRALIADDRPEVRALVAARLRELGVSRIDAVSPDDIGVHLLGLASGEAMADAPEPTSPERLVEVVARFAHDVGSPLTTALLSSRILATGTSDRPAEDAQHLHACVEEIAGMVRTLARQVASADPRRGRRS